MSSRRAWSTRTFPAPGSASSASTSASRACCGYVSLTPCSRAVRLDGVHGGSVRRVAGASSVAYARRVRWPGVR